MIHEQFEFTERDQAFFLSYGYHIFPRFLSDKGLSLARDRTDYILNELHNSVDPEWIMNVHQQGECWVSEIAAHPKVIEVVRAQFDACAQSFNSNLGRAPVRRTNSSLTHKRKRQPTSQICENKVDDSESRNDRRCRWRIALQQSHLFCKKAACPRIVPWHQDGRQGQTQETCAEEDPKAKHSGFAAQAEENKAKSRAEESDDQVELPWPAATLWIPLDDVDAENGEEIR
jgi:hypothetical protein